jgi:5'-deoxynucleotidase YfbR-like HD superfamily hydrolase
MQAATDYVTTIPRTEQERRGRIRTFTGRYVNPLQLQPEDIEILDIAHHLSNICRYTGACPDHYSVAQHSVYVARRMWVKHVKWEAGMAGLLHDAAEAYFNDIASPVKRDPRMTWYCDLEHEATKMIFRVFGVSEEWLPLTKEFDDELFRDEVASWWGGADMIQPWVLDDKRYSRHKFLMTFNQMWSLR